MIELIGDFAEELIKKREEKKKKCDLKTGYPSEMVQGLILTNRSIFSRTRYLFFL